ncbi:MAG TPA: hypothetical protein PKB07_12875 [Flavilitoribacter sp.]|nr:hypothetical protein [Flavilitoribacter sp.]
MENITTDYLLRAECWLFFNTLVYFLMNGAQLFETLVLVPKWTAAPPQSFNLLADKNGVSLKTFWTVFHSIHEVIFILTIIFSWKLPPVRNGLLFLFAAHFAVRAWTLAYFAPVIIGFEKMIAGTVAEQENLGRKTAQWRKLNYIRVGLFIAVSLGLIPLLWQLFHIQATLFG